GGAEVAVRGTGLDHRGGRPAADQPLLEVAGGDDVQVEQALTVHGEAREAVPGLVLLHDVAVVHEGDAGAAGPQVGKGEVRQDGMREQDRVHTTRHGQVAEKAR